MATLGQQLKAKREAKGVTEFEAGAKTKILTKLIVGMEADDFSEMAAPTYAKGFIRIYAAYLGLDPKPLVTEYIETHAPKEKTSANQTIQIREEKGQFRQKILPTTSSISRHQKKPIEFNVFATIFAAFFSKILKKRPKFDIRMLATGVSVLLILGVLIISFSSRYMPSQTAVKEILIPDAAYQLLNEPLPDLYLVELGKIEGVR